MIKRHASWLAVSTVLALGTTGNAAALGLVCEPTKLSFRTTEWLNPFDFNASITDAGGTVTVGKVDTSLGPDKTPATVLLPAEGGVLSRNLEVPPGFRIKKVLVCAQTSAPESLPLLSPIPGLTVSLTQNLPSASSRSLSFQRMAISAPSCAVYRVVDDTGLLANSVDPRISPTTLSITVPAATPAEISGIGLRLQAVPTSPLWTFVPYHEHAYLTGRGVGHNNTVAVTSGPSDECLDEATIFSGDSDDLSDFAPALPTVDPTTVINKGGKGKGKGKGKNK